MDINFVLSKLSSSQPGAEPSALIKETSQQTFSIEGITNQTVLNYKNYLSANNFGALLRSIRS